MPELIKMIIFMTMNEKVSSMSNRLFILSPLYYKNNYLPLYLDFAILYFNLNEKCKEFVKRCIILFYKILLNFQYRNLKEVKMKRIILMSSLLFLSANAVEFNADMKNYIQSLKVEAVKENPNFKDFSIKNGEQIFTSSHIGKKGVKISCTSCHNTDLSTVGKNHFTNKEIDPLSPNTNSKRLVDVKDVKKWLKRNFNDVYNRVGTAQEKGDVLYYINSK